MVYGKDKRLAKIKTAFSHGALEQGRERVVGLTRLPNRDGEESLAFSDARVEQQAGRDVHGRSLAAAPTGLVLFGSHGGWSVNHSDFHRAPVHSTRLRLLAAATTSAAAAEDSSRLWRTPSGPADGR